MDVDTNGFSNFPKTREARLKGLKDLVRDGVPSGTKKIPGRNGGNRDVYRIPLNLLSYNPYNTRFLSEAKTLEHRVGKLSDENPEHVKYIEDFLWKWKKDKNINTIDSLIADGQLDPGVVTRDGIILSGNRRFRLLNEINRHMDKYAKPDVNLEGLDYFEAVILEEPLTTKQIIKYESFYQYGTEEKVDYNPIEKYIAAHDQIQQGFTEEEIYKNFQAIAKDGVKTVKLWLEVFELMDEYLVHIGEPSVYTALNTAEEAFLSINGSLKSLQSGRGRSRTLWAFNPFDVANFKRVAFDYIHNGTATHDFRDLFKIFQNESAWKSFVEEHKKIMASETMDTFDEYRAKNPDSNETEIAKKRKLDFESKYKKPLNKAFGYEKARIEGEKAEEAPLGILKAAMDKLKKFEALLEANGDDALGTDEYVSKLREIQSLSGNLKQRLD